MHSLGGETQGRGVNKASYILTPHRSPGFNPLTQEERVSHDSEPKLRSLTHPSEACGLTFFGSLVTRELTEATKTRCDSPLCNDLALRA